jgi:hypothetical protein
MLADSTGPDQPDSEPRFHACCVALCPWFMAQGAAGL